MTNWEMFENEACTFLNSCYKNTPLAFRAWGGSDSTASDIEVYKYNNYIFSIEAKLSPCQSGQFVVINDGDSYSYSNRNKYAGNIHTRQIIRYINDNFDYYQNIEQFGVDIDCPDDILFNWIINHYRSKNSRFIITSDMLDGYMSVIPIEAIGNYFEVSAVLRRKKSGSRNVPISQYALAKAMLKKHLSKFEIGIKEFLTDKGNIIVTLNPSVILDRSDCYFGDNMFLSKDRYSEGYKIKMLSKTNNVNVVFSLRYIGPDSMTGFDYFTNYIKQF